MYLSEPGLPICSTFSRSPSLWLALSSSKSADLGSPVASSDYFRKSMFPFPDPGPNYVRYKEEYRSKKAEGFGVSLGKIIEAPTVGDHIYTAPESTIVPDAASLQDACTFFETFKCLFADLILSVHNIANSQSSFRNRTCDEGFRVIEIELGFMHDVFYTKADVIYSFWGGVLRFVSFSCIVSVFATFLLSQGNQSYKTIDVIITYVLLAGAIGLEIYSVLLLLASDWTILWLSKHRNIAVHLFYKDISLFAPSENKRWSNSVAQYNLVSFCLNDEPARYHYCRFFKRVPCIYQLTVKYLYKSTLRVPKELKVLIFEQLLKKSTSDFSNRKKLCAQRGRWVLNKEICDLERVGWSIEDAEFDQSILLWHSATDLCYHINLDEDSTSVLSPNATENSKLLSEYMLYLLVTHPFMLPNAIGQIRFQDTCAEEMEFFEERKSITDTKKACEALLDLSTKIPPSEVKGDRSKSVLFDACALANDLQSLEEKQNWDKEKKWELISHVWVEMLSYAASQCQRSQHAQQLRQGGELLTHVWLLMAHLGITEQFQISKGHARAKLLAQ